MKYLGSKNRISKHILPIMLKSFKDNNLDKWVEPFVGGGNMIDKVPHCIFRIGYDINPHTINALIAIRDYLDKLPNSVSEEYYKQIKSSNPEPISSWIRFVCSFGGKFENGYAREKGSDDTTFVRYGINNAIKQSSNLQNVELYVGDYKNCSDYKNCLIYCDPPYQNTTGYKTKKFNHDEFFQWCRVMSLNNKVFISEYNAPSDFKCIWEGRVKTNFSSSRLKATHQAIEKLYTL